MAKIQIKSEKLTPFGGFFRVMEQFDSTLSSVIYSTLGLLSTSVLWIILMTGPSTVSTFSVTFPKELLLI